MLSHVMTLVGAFTRGEGGIKLASQGPKGPEPALPIVPLCQLLHMYTQEEKLKQII